MLGSVWTRTARRLDVFLELVARSTPPAVWSYDSWDRPSRILWEDLVYVVFFLHFLFSKPLLKDKPELRKRQDDRLSLFLIIRISQNNTHSVQEKRSFVKIRASRGKMRFWCWKKSCRSRAESRSGGTVQGLFLLWPVSLLFTWERKRVLRCKPGCTCKMFPTGFPLFVPLLIPSAGRVSTEHGLWNWEDKDFMFNLESFSSYFLSLQHRSRKNPFAEEKLLETDDNGLGSCSQLKSNEKNMVLSKTPSIKCWQDTLCSW